MTQIMCTENAWKNNQILMSSVSPELSAFLQSAAAAATSSLKIQGGGGIRQTDSEQSQKGAE